jgi:lysophospholipase
MTMPDRRTMPAEMIVSRWIAPDGWDHRRYEWPAGSTAGRGSILFQAGRADYIEKYLEPLAHWHERGWHLSGFDWRGQGRSGRLLADPRTGHLASIDPLVDDLAAFVAAWRAETPGPHVLIGHSMGGHVMLRLMAEQGVAVDAAVLAAPMLGVNSAPLPGWAARSIARAACRVGRSERRAWEPRDNPATHRLRQRALTHCEDRYADSAWWKAGQPDLGLGPPSWGWIAAAFASTAALRRPGVLERTAVPILLIGAERDRLVTAGAIRAAAARLPAAELHMVPDAAHELLREADAVRLPIMAHIDQFLDKHAARP